MVTLWSRSGRLCSETLQVADCIENRMKPMISFLGALAVMAVMTAPLALAQSCNQRAADLQQRQTAAQKLADTRLTLVEDVEAAGDAWENAEAMRNFSEAQADEADATKIEYETLKADLLQKELSLQALLVSLNEEVAAYNASCINEQG